MMQWLGDAQLAFDTIQHNFDGGAFCETEPLVQLLY